MRSLKQRLIVWAAIASIGLTTVAGLALYGLARGYLVGQFDDALMRKVRLLASTIEIEKDALDLQFRDLDTSEFASPQAGGYLQVWHGGKSIYRSPSLAESNLPATGQGDEDTTLQWSVLPGGLEGRGVVYRFAPGMDVPDEDEPAGSGIVDAEAIPLPEGSRDVEVTLALFRNTDQIARPLGALRIGLAGIGLALALLMSLVIAVCVGRGLRPVQLLSSRVSTLDERSLDQRLELPQLPLELAPIVTQFNGLLERLGVAFERERGFSADIAHELRTPLAGLRTTLEVTLLKPRDSRQYAACLEESLEITTQMQSMVEGLLRLAALENGQMKPVMEEVCIDREIDAAWRAAGQNGASTRSFKLHRNGNDVGPIRTDPALLGVILRNILQNAASYVNDDGVVEVGSKAFNGDIEIRVVNSGSKVAAEDASRVFDRFWRADRSRSQTGLRFGLGLATVKLAAEALGGSAMAQSEAGGNFTMIVRLPVKGCNLVVQESELPSPLPSPTNGRGG